jgi:hypothetical protein
MQHYVNRRENISNWNVVTFNFGRAIAQAVSRRLPTPAARVRAQVRWCGICGGQSGTCTFSPSASFSLPVLLPPTAPHSSSSIIRDWYSRPITGRRTKWTAPRETKWKKLCLLLSMFLSPGELHHFNCYANDSMFMKQQTVRVPTFVILRFASFFFKQL